MAKRGSWVRYMPELCADAEAMGWVRGQLCRVCYLGLSRSRPAHLDRAAPSHGAGNGSSSGSGRGCQLLLEGGGGSCRRSGGREGAGGPHTCGVCMKKCEVWKYEVMGTGWAKGHSCFAFYPRPHLVHTC